MHTSIAERLAFGTPARRSAGETPIHVVPRATTALVGRILISAIFLASGYTKLTDTANVIAYMNSVGIPYADTLVYVAGIAELAGAGALVLGLLTRLAGLGLMLYLIPVTAWFHGFWRLEGAEAQVQMFQFMKNLAIFGGLALLVAFGAGPRSLDGRIRRPKQA
jgi:putative oxidoreductase